MENFIDDYHGAFEPSKIDEINEAMEIVAMKNTYKKILLRRKMMNCSYQNMGSQ